MKMMIVVLGLLILPSFISMTCENPRKDLERPEPIVSKRQVIYDSATYARLAQLWKDYYDVYPSDEAYGNWMYAARYAELPDYRSLLEKGVEKYPAGPKLLYLLGNEKLTHQTNLEGLQVLEKAAAFDPRYMDPWYGLVFAYLSQGDREKSDVALRSLLDGGAVQDVVMDFCYNMIASLVPGSILITNGDNDTYPGLILTRIIGFRPDVTIVNRSLLNTDWYPPYLMKKDLPPFISLAGFDSLKAMVNHDFEQVKRGTIAFEDAPLLGDRLIGRIVDAGKRVGRPVYFACTLENAKTIKGYSASGRPLGLVTLVTPTSQSYDAQIRTLFRAWEKDFRTGGLDSWHIRAAKGSSAGRMLARNYAFALNSLKDQIAAAGETEQLSLFRWYRDHLLALLPAELADDTNKLWQEKSMPREIREWCKAQGIGQ
jgi:hypothetical protein